MRSRLAVLLILSLLVLPALPANGAYPGPDGGVVFSLSSGDLGYIGQPGATPQALPRVTSQNANDQPHLSPDGDEVAFIFNGPFNSQVWSYSFAEQRLIQYTTDQMPITGARSPSWLPDGSAIVFSAQSATDLSANLYSVPRGGGELRQLSTDIAPLEPHVSPAGDQVLYWNEANNTVNFFDLQTGVSREVFRSDPAGIYLGQDRRDVDEQGRTVLNIIEPDWAPDAQSFVVNCLGLALCRIAADGSGVQVLTPVRQDQSYSGGAFTPSGSEILYSHVKTMPPGTTTDFVPRIWAMPAAGLGPNGEGQTQVTFPSSQNEANSNREPTVGVQQGTTPPPPGTLTTPLPPGSAPEPGDPTPDQATPDQATPHPVRGMVQACSHRTRQGPPRCPLQTRTAQRSNSPRPGSPTGVPQRGGRFCRVTTTSRTRWPVRR